MWVCSSHVKCVVQFNDFVRPLRLFQHKTFIFELLTSANSKMKTRLTVQSVFRSLQWFLNTEIVIDLVFGKWPHILPYLTRAFGPLVSFGARSSYLQLNQIIRPFSQSLWTNHMKSMIVKSWKGKISKRKKVSRANVFRAISSTGKCQKA